MDRIGIRHHLTSRQSPPTHFSLLSSKVQLYQVFLLTTNSPSSPNFSNHRDGFARCHYWQTLAFRVGLEGYTTAGDGCIKLQKNVLVGGCIRVAFGHGILIESIDILSDSFLSLQGGVRTTLHSSVLTCTVGSPRNKLSQGRNSQPMVADQLWCVRA